MSENRRGFWREPLLHFVVLGVLIFGVDRYLNNGERAFTPETIYVGPDDVARLASVFEERWGRTPSAEERAELIDDFVREEILYREALSLGLDDGDTIVRRRLAQKLAFVSQDNAANEGPTDAELRTWFDANKDVYTVSPRYTFLQVFFEAESEARVALDGLRASPNPATASGTGDESPVPLQFSEANEAGLREQFGAAFVDRIAEAEPGNWTGPIASKHGFHVVFLRQRIDGYAPEFSDVRGVVESDWLAEQSKSVNPAYYDEVRGKYDVVFDDALDVIP